MDCKRYRKNIRSIREARSFDNAPHSLRHVRSQRHAIRTGGVRADRRLALALSHVINKWYLTTVAEIICMQVLDLASRAIYRDE